VDSNNKNIEDLSPRGLLRFKDEGTKIIRNVETYSPNERHHMPVDKPSATPPSEPQISQPDYTYGKIQGQSRFRETPPCLRWEFLTP